MSIEATPINNKRVEIRVNEGVVKEGGIFSSNYVTYKITTSPLNWEVRRKDTDFFFLRKILLRQFPHIVVPPLPAKSNKQTVKFMKKREKYYTRFLSAITRCEELKSSKFLVEFLSETDVKKFQKAHKEFEKIKYGRYLPDLTTAKGEAKVKMTANSAAFCTKMFDYVDSYQILYKEIIECAKEINDRSQELACTMFALHKFIEQMGDLNRMIKCQPQFEVFAWLSKMITGQGNYIAESGDLIEKYLGSHLKFNLDEHESFRELY